MTTPWQNILDLAREIDAAGSKGGVDAQKVESLARYVTTFEEARTSGEVAARPASRRFAVRKGAPSQVTTPWERVLYLASEVDEAVANGALDPSVAARLARAVLEFQSALVGRSYARPA